MRIDISTKDMELTPSLAAFIEEKLGQVAKHLQKFEMEGELLLRVHAGRITEHHHKGEVFEATADIALPGEHLRAAETGEDLHTVIDMTRDTLEREIRKYKTKHS